MFEKFVYLRQYQVHRNFLYKSLSLTINRYLLHFPTADKSDKSIYKTLCKASNVFISICAVTKMEVSTETDSDLGQSDPWIMLEDSDIEVCDEPSNSKEAPNKETAAKQSEPTANQVVEEDDFAKLRKHRKFIEQLEATEDLTWDSSDITPETTKIAEESPATKAVCTRCSICSVLLTKGGSKIASYLRNTFLALCVLVVASGLAYYFQFPDQIKKSNLKDVLVRYTQPDYAVRYDWYMGPKYEKNKKGFYHTDANKYIYYRKYDDTSRKREKKSKNDQYYGQKEYKRAQDKKRYYKNSLDEKRYDKKDFHKKAYKQEYREFKQKKNRKLNRDYKRK